MKTFLKLIKSPLFWIFFLALFLRIYKLGEFPIGFHVDEVKTGWNALSLLKTGRDDHLSFLPLYYDSFGDFRPAGIFYFTVPSIILFGRNIFATRFPVALFGALTVFPVYLLINLVSQKYTGKKKINIGHLAAFIFSISPWSIEMGRATNEAVISVFFALFSIYFLIKFIKAHQKKYFLYAILFIAVSYFLYHSIRFLAPFYFTGAAVFYFKEIKSQKIRFYISAAILGVLLLTIYFGFAVKGLGRLNQTSILGSIDVNYEIQRIRAEDMAKNIFTVIFDNKFVSYTKVIINGYGNYFSSDFLLGSSAKPYRFTTPGAGLITYIELLLILLGLVQIARGRASPLVLLFLILSPIPAALTVEDSPNLSRAYFMNPFLSMIAASGFYLLISYSKKYRKMAILITTGLLIVNFTYFAWMYFKHSANHSPYIKDYFVDSPTYRDVGATDLVKQLDDLSKNYDRIIVTNFPDNLYPWYAYLTNKSPLEFNKTFSKSTNERVWGNIVFSEDKCPSDDAFWKLSNKNILVVDNWECAYQSQIKAGSPIKVVSKIFRADNSEVYILLERDWNKNFPKEIQQRIIQTSQK